MSAPKVPRPPELREDMSDEERVLVVLQAFAAAHREYTATLDNPDGEAWWGGPRGWRNGETANLPKWRTYKAALNAANAMLDAGVRPVEWAAWRCDFLLGATRKERTGRKPFFNQVFSANTIRTKSGWFRKDQPQLGGRAQPGPKFRELMVRYGRMETALRLSTGPIAPVVTEFFPPGLYDRLVAEAQAEAQQRKEDFRRRMQQGEWIWR